MSSMLPFHVPVEKPANVCGGERGRWSRPSSQIVRSMLLEVHAQVNREHALRQRIEDCSTRMFARPRIE